MQQPMRGRISTSILVPHTDTLLPFPVTEKELKRLHRRFKKLDKDGSGTLTIDEFTSIPELAGTDFWLQAYIAVFGLHSGCRPDPLP